MLAIIQQLVKRNCLLECWSLDSITFCFLWETRKRVCLFAIRSEMSNRVKKNLTSTRFESLSDQINFVCCENFFYIPQQFSFLAQFSTHFKNEFRNLKREKCEHDRTILKRVKRRSLIAVMRCWVYLFANILLQNATNHYFVSHSH